MNETALDAFAVWRKDHKKEAEETKDIKATKKKTTLQQWTNVTWSRPAEFDGDGGSEIKKGEIIPGRLFFPGEFAKAGGGEPAEDRWVDFHTDLEDHLKAMYERRDPESDWMFPSHRYDGPVKRFNKQLFAVRRA